MRKRNGTDGVKMRNGTDGVKMRNGTDMGFKLSFNLIFVPFRIFTPYPFRSASVPFRIRFRILT
jgi:hypothetical protein